jgi:hypothetical protein
MGSLQGAFGRFLSVDEFQPPMMVPVIAPAQGGKIAQLSE